MLTICTNLRTERDSDRDINSEDTAVITFYLQNVITCPRADVGDHFYKRKICVYNLTGYSKVNGDKDVYCVVQGGAGGDEITSSVPRAGPLPLLKFLSIFYIHQVMTI